MDTLKAGALDREIVIEQATESQGTRGEPLRTWTTFAAVWAAVLPLRSSERFRSDQTYASRVATFRVRYLEGVEPTMRVSYEGRKYRIIGISEVNRREGLDITAEAVE